MHTKVFASQCFFPTARQNCLGNCLWHVPWSRSKLQCPCSKAERTKTLQKLNCQLLFVQKSRRKLLKAKASKPWKVWLHGFFPILFYTLEAGSRGLSWAVKWSDVVVARQQFGLRKTFQTNVSQYRQYKPNLEGPHVWISFEIKCKNPQHT